MASIIALKGFADLKSAKLNFIQIRRSIIFAELITSRNFGSESGEETGSLKLK